MKDSKDIIFQWDKGNKTKNWIKHKVSIQEQEEAFYDKNAIIEKDKFHSKKEERHILIGKTKNNKILYIAFTVRNERIRIISARSINRKEVLIYEKKTNIT